MPIEIYTHAACLAHDTGPDHAERPARLLAVTEALRTAFPARLDWREAPRASRGNLLRVHAASLLHTVLETRPTQRVMLDPDTALSPASAEAALRAAGAAVAAVDAVLAGNGTRAFCAVRPPGHHATADTAKGFCLFTNLAVAAAHALAMHGLERVAIAEEILQEAFVSVWHYAATYDAAKSQPLTWLTSIVRNRCLDQRRRREVDTVSVAHASDDDAPARDIAAEGPTPVELLLAGAQARSVRDCVEALDAGPRQAIALAFFQGLSHAELAAHLREPLGTVKSWIRRGLERLRRCLDAAGVAG
jgi:RNA polymerase sigma factor (sigma-70 family)